MRPAAQSELRWPLRVALLRSTHTAWSMELLYSWHFRAVIGHQLHTLRFVAVEAIIESHSINSFVWRRCRAAQQNGSGDAQPSMPLTGPSALASSAVSLTDSMVAGGGPGTTPAGTTSAEAPDNGSVAAQTPAAALLGLRVSAEIFADLDVGRPPHSEIPDG